MSEKKCSYLERDGFAGIWCGVGGNNKNYNCRKFKRKVWFKTEEEQLKKEIDELKEENEQLKKDINKRIVDYNGLNAEYEWLKEENKHLKQRNKRQYNQLTELWSLIEAKDWETLTEMDNRMKEEDE